MPYTHTLAAALLAASATLLPCAQATALLPTPRAGAALGHVTILAREHSRRTEQGR